MAQPFKPPPAAPNRGLDKRLNQSERSGCRIELRFDLLI